MSEPYRAFQEAKPCKRCGEGETWTVIGPQDICIGESWSGENAQHEAECRAQELNAAYDEGYRTACRDCTSTSKGDGK